MRIFLIIILAIVIIIGGAAFYFINKINYQPDWYKEKSEAPVGQMLDRAPQTERRIRQEMAEQSAVSLNEAQLTELVLMRAQNQTSIDVKKTIRGAKTTLKKDQVEMELMVDLNQFRAGALPQQAKDLLDKAGSIMGDEVYVKIKALPQRTGQRTILSDQSTVQLGNLKLSLSRLKKMGIVNQAVLDKIDLSNIEFNEGSVTLRK